MNKISETKKSKDNGSGADNTGNNKNKYTKKRKKDQHSNNNSRGNKKKSPWSAITVDRIVTL